MSLWTKFRDTLVGAAKVGIGSALGGPIGGLIAGSFPSSSRRRIPVDRPRVGTPPIINGGGRTNRFPTVAGTFPGGAPIQRGFVGPVAGAVIRGGIRVLKSPAVRTTAAAAAGAILGEAIDGDGQVVQVVARRKRRRMNPCNPKALNRAVRRLAMYHKQNKKIEVQLRKLAPRPRARRAVAHHHHPQH